MERRPFLDLALLVALGLLFAAPAAAQPQPQPQPIQDPAAQPIPPPPGGDTKPADTQQIPPPPGDPVPPPPAQPEAVTPAQPAHPPMSPQELSDGNLRLEQDPILRIEGWLQRNNERAAIGRIASAILAIVMGAASITGAVWAFGLDDVTGRQLLGATFVGLGAMNMAMGVAFLNITTPQEDRWERWQQARRRGATAVDVAGFEGEFRSEAEMMRFQRVVAGILGLSMAVGGGAIIALTAADRDLADDELIVGYALGGTFLITGALVGLLSLVVKSPIEQDWESYQRGATPADPTAVLF